MEAVQPLSGGGALTVEANWYRECASLIVWPLGRYGVKNRPQFMRKWYHRMSVIGHTSSSLNGDTDISPATGALASGITTVASLTPTGGGPALPLQTPSGHTPTAPGYLYKYLEHHQFGR